MRAKMHAAYFKMPSGDRVPITQNGIVGRATEADITFASPGVSRQHAKLEMRTGSWWLVDLTSKNGTFVNGVELVEIVGLVEGDTVVFGGAVTVTFHDPAATPIAPRIGRLDGVWIDPATNAVWVDATRVEPPLSPKQLTLLQLLVEHRGEVVTRPAIVATVWVDDAAEGVTDDAVAALVKRLRARLREGPLRRDYVEVVKGRGVRLPSG